MRLALYWSGSLSCTGLGCCRASTADLWPSTSTVEAARFFHSYSQLHRPTQHCDPCLRKNCSSNSSPPTPLRGKRLTDRAVCVIACCWFMAWGNKSIKKIEEKWIFSLLKFEFDHPTYSYLLWTRYCGCYFISQCRFFLPSGPWQIPVLLPSSLHLFQSPGCSFPASGNWNSLTNLEE